MIGVFDSGFGGLSILNKLEEDLPEFEYFYYGDNLNAPYGNKKEEEIYKLTKSALDFMFNRGAVLILVACNTVSVKVLSKIQKEYNKVDKKILGIIIPNVEYISNLPKNAKLGLIGTTHTINSGKYRIEIEKRRSDLTIITKDCPKFAGFIERGKSKTLDSLSNIKEEMGFFNNKKIEYLFLACTHYSFIKNQIKKNIGKDIQIMDTVDIISKKTQDYLKRHKSLKINKSKISYFYSSSSSSKVYKTALELHKNLSNRSFELLKKSIFAQD